MRRFGIELEHANSINHHAMVTRLEEAGLTVDHTATGQYRSHGYAGWQVKHDMSIHVRRTHPNTIELVSPPLPFNEESKEQVKAALRVANETGSVNRSCGFHVHVEARDLNEAQKIANIFQ